MGHGARVAVLVQVRLAARKLGSAAMLAVVAGLSCSGDSPTTPEAPVPTTITLSATGVSLASLGETSSLTATVKDQRGAAIAGQSITWSSSDQSIATVSGGVITAIANGTAMVTGASGQLTASATVTVSQVAATVLITPDSLSFTAATDTVSVTGNVTDARGNALVTQPKVAWRVNDTTIATVDSLGLVTSVGSGVTTLTGTSGQASAAVSVTVNQIAASLALDSASVTLTSIAGTRLLAASVADTRGAAIARPSISWSSSDSSVATVQDGTVTAVANGTAVVTATISELTAEVSVTVSQVATAYLVSPATATPPAGTSVIISAQAVDANGYAVALEGKVVSWSKSDAVGSLTATSSNTDGAGRATVAFNAPIIAGNATTVTAADGDGLSGTTGVITTVAGPPDQADLLDYETQVNWVGLAAEKKPGVRLSDEYGNRVPDIPVLFSVESGGGAVTGGSVVTDAQGEARVSSWTMGSTSATNSLSIQVPGFTTGMVYSRAVPVSTFPLGVRILAGTPSRYQGLLSSAAERWRKAITTGSEEVFVYAGEHECFTGQPALSESTTGVIVFAEVKPIDGVGGTLAQAGTCLVRDDTGVPVVGYMAFDLADLDLQIAQGSAFATVVHELGHILGIGLNWDFWGLRQDVGTSDPIFIGTNARWAFGQMGGSSYSGRIVPLENTFGAGSRDVHWRESVMGPELMTSAILSGESSSPFSAITLYGLKDMGYEIADLGYDDYLVTSNSMASQGGVHVELYREDLHFIRTRFIDRDGNVVSEPEWGPTRAASTRPTDLRMSDRIPPASTPAIQPRPLKRRR